MQILSLPIVLLKKRVRIYYSMRITQWIGWQEHPGRDGDRHAGRSGRTCR
jgi:hypothetical protein